MSSPKTKADVVKIGLSRNDLEALIRNYVDQVHPGRALVNMNPTPTGYEVVLRCKT